MIRILLIGDNDMKKTKKSVEKIKRITIFQEERILGRYIPPTLLTTKEIDGHIYRLISIEDDHCFGTIHETWKLIS